MLLQVLTLGREGKQAFEEVFMFSHQDARTRASFVSLTTQGGVQVSATPGHYLWAAQAQGNASHHPWALVRAGDISIGTCLLSANSSPVHSDGCNLVMERAMTVQLGLYNPHTASGSIVVDGVAAATFSDILPPSVAAHSAVTGPFRWLSLCRVADSVHVCEVLNSAILWPLARAPGLHALVGHAWVALASMRPETA